MFPVYYFACIIYSAEIKKSNDLQIKSESKKNASEKSRMKTPLKFCAYFDVPLVISCHNTAVLDLSGKGCKSHATRTDVVSTIHVRVCIL